MTENRALNNIIIDQDLRIKLKEESDDHFLLKGTFYLMFSQFIFLLCGYGVHIYLARVFGPVEYGVFGVVISILIWFELAIIRGLPTTIQNYIAKKQYNAYAIKKFSLRIQLYFSAIIMGFMFFFAPNIARILKDERLIFYLRLSSIDVIIYGAYSIYLGVQNGLREFKKQSAMIIMYSSGKLLSIFLLVTLGFSVSGALVGNMLGSLFGLSIGIAFTRLEKNSAVNFNRNELIKFTVPIIFLFLGNELLNNLDLWCIKYFLTDEVAGYYTAAQNVARVPLFLFFALSFTLLPSLSKSISERDNSITKIYISQAIRIILLILIPLTLLVLSTSKGLIVLLYSNIYEPSAAILNILIIGFAFFTFFVTISSVIIADNKPHILFLITGMLVLIDFLLNTQLIPLWKAKGAAISTSIATFLGALIIGVIVARKFKTFISLKSFVKILLASVCIFGISNFYSAQGFMLLLNYLFLSCLYVGLLFLFGEINVKDFRNLKGIVRYN